MPTQACFILVGTARGGFRRQNGKFWNLPDIVLNRRPVENTPAVLGIAQSRVRSAKPIHHPMHKMGFARRKVFVPSVIRVWHVPP